MQVRLIQISNTSGSKEGVIFTDDFDADAADWCNRDTQVDNVEVLDIELPSGFPLNYILWRE